MSEIRKNSDEISHPKETKTIKLIQIKIIFVDNIMILTCIKIHQAFNKDQEPLINNDYMHININEISLPLESQNNIKDETFLKSSIPAPFTNYDINQKFSQ